MKLDDLDDDNEGRWYIFKEWMGTQETEIKTLLPIYILLGPCYREREIKRILE